MKTRSIVLAVATTFWLVSSLAQAQRPYVIDNNGNKIVGVELTADAAGTRSLKINDKVNRTFSKRDVRVAFTPKPNAVAALEKAFAQGNFKVFDTHAAKVLKAYGYLGWGDLIVALQARIAVDRNEAQRALQLVGEAREYAGVNTAQVALAQAAALAIAERYDDAEKLFGRLFAGLRSERDLASAYLYRAAMFEKQGDKQRAVNDCLKVYWILDSEKVGADVRESARKKAIALMKDIGDNRYKELE